MEKRVESVFSYEPFVRMVWFDISRSLYKIDA